MAFLEPTIGLITLLIFGVAMILITWFFTRHKGISTEYFLLANRNVGWLFGAGSIAASWIWAPALFISSQMAYQLGLAGIFWFVFPNIIAVLIFIFLAPRIRERFPQGYTLPQYICHKLNDSKIHKIYFFGYSFYQLMAVSVQLFAGSSLIFLLTGISLEVSILVLAGIVFSYTWLSGFESSVVTDFVQLLMIFAGLVIIIPLVIGAAGGFEAISNGIGGITGKYENIFDLNVAFSFGIVTSIGLISGAISDQQFWQRAFAFNKGSIVPGFLAGGIFFGIVPVALSLLGFIAASPSSGIELGTEVDLSLIGVLVVAKFLPQVFLIVFVLMLLAGLASTLDSGLSAFSSLYAVDAKIYTNSDDLSAPRSGMLLILILGIVVALITAYIPQFGLKQLWWIFNAVGATLVIPTILSLYWERLTAKGAFYGIVSALVIGLPLFVYSNFVNDTLLIVGSAIFIISVNLVLCWVFRGKENVTIQ